MEARDLFRPDANITEELGALRKVVFVCAAKDRLDFDALCDRVLARLAETSPSRRAA